jgi:hypothetical protein
MVGYAANMSVVMFFFSTVIGQLEPPSMEPLTPQNVDMVLNNPRNDSAVVFGEHIRLNVALLQATEELATLLSTMNDWDSIRPAASRAQELSDFIDALHRRERNLPPMTQMHAALIRSSYEVRLPAANKRLSDQLARIRSRPDILFNLAQAGAHFIQNNGADDAHNPIDDTGVLPANTRPGDIPHTGPMITVVVRGVHERMEQRPEVEAIIQNFREIVQELSPGQFANVSMYGVNNRRIYSVSPVDNPQAFADRITCGRVTRVAGRRIDVLFTEPAQEADPAP